MEKDISSVKWSTTVDKVRKILGEVALYGEVYKN